MLLVKGFDRNNSGDFPRGKTSIVHRGQWCQMERWTIRLIDRYITLITRDHCVGPWVLPTASTGQNCKKKVVGDKNRTVARAAQYSAGGALTAEEDGSPSFQPSSSSHPLEDSRPEIFEMQSCGGSSASNGKNGPSLQEAGQKPCLETPCVSVAGRWRLG